MRHSIPLLLFLSLAHAQPAVPRFVEETETAGIDSRFDGDYVVGGGVAAFDCDGNGLPDLLIAAGDNPARLYRNHSPVGGALKFVEEKAGLNLTQVVGAYPLDVDADGKPDLVVLRSGEDLLLRGKGNCQFERANELWKFAGGNDWSTAFAATWEKGHDWPTLAIGKYINREAALPWGSCTDNLLYRPGAGGFAAPTALKPSFCALSMLFSDWNRSGQAALRVSNDREYYRGGGEQLWEIAPFKTPRLYSEADGWKRLQIWGMGIASQDLNGDGFPEYALTSMGDTKLQSLQSGEGQPSFKDIAFRSGTTAHRPYTGGDVHMSTGWHAQFEDVNHDGSMDLFIAKGNVGFMRDAAAKDPNNLLLGKAEGGFVEAGDKAGVASFLRGRGAQLVDLNADGWLDLVVVNRLDQAQLWRNQGAQGSSGNWLQLRLSQPGGNRDAIGAWIQLQTPSQMIQKELTAGGGHASGGLGWIHFGLGTASTVKLRVQWPHSGWGEWTQVRANQFLTVDKIEGIKGWNPK
jgi:hypothetical protein